MAKWMIYYRIRANAKMENLRNIEFLSVQCGFYFPFFFWENSAKRKYVVCNTLESDLNIHNKIHQQTEARITQMNGNHLMSFPCNSFRIFTLFIWWFNTINDIYFSVLPFSRNRSISTLWIFLFKDQEKWNADWNLMFSNMQMDRLPLNNFQVLLLLAGVVGISYFLLKFFFFQFCLCKRENVLLLEEHFTSHKILCQQKHHFQ